MVWKSAELEILTVPLLHARPSASLAEQERDLAVGVVEAAVAEL